MTLSFKNRLALMLINIAYRVDSEVTDSWAESIFRQKRQRESLAQSFNKITPFINQLGQWLIDHGIEVPKNV